VDLLCPPPGELTFSLASLADNHPSGKKRSWKSTPPDTLLQYGPRHPPVPRGVIPPTPLLGPEREKDIMRPIHLIKPLASLSTHNPSRYPLPRFNISVNAPTPHFFHFQGADLLRHKKEISYSTHPIH